MLELRGLTVAYGGVEILHGVEMSLSEGEVVGMVGPNGAGKSSLLRAICGLTRSNAGEISFEGRSLLGLAPEEIARLGIALVPEGRQIFGTLTVAENLRLAVQGDESETMEQVLGSLEKTSAHLALTLNMPPIGIPRGSRFPESRFSA